MKKITMLIESDSDLDLNDLMRRSLDFRVEDVTAKDAAKERGEPRKIARFHDKTISSVIMSHYVPQGVVTVNIAQGWMIKEGFNQNSAAPGLRELVERGYMSKVDGAIATFQYVKPFAPGQLRAA